MLNSASRCVAAADGVAPRAPRVVQSRAWERSRRPVPSSWLRWTAWCCNASAVSAPTSQKLVGWALFRAKGDALRASSGLAEPPI